MLARTRLVSGFVSGLVPAALAAALALVPACRDRNTSGERKQSDQPAQSTSTAAPAGGRVLLVAQAQFRTVEGKPVPGPAKLVLLRPGEDRWTAEVIEDPGSNVFHKAVVWRGGLLTIGAEDALLRHWTRAGGAGGEWRAETLWKRSWGGRFDRLRDLEIGDVDGDGREDLVIGTHDKGVVAVGREGDAGWQFTEVGEQPDTFVHEIELGDVDGDGRREIYCTPSARNRSDGTSQGGGVVRYRFVDGALVREPVIHWDASHAKEILVTDVDGDGTDELYVVREAHVDKSGGEARIVDPVTILALAPQADGSWQQRVVATIEDRQSRFLVPADIDGDGDRELIASGMTSGLWLLEPAATGPFTATSIDRDSSGFEHAVHPADFDGDGADELYVAADRQQEIRRYRWKDGELERKVLADIPAGHITWNLADGELGPTQQR